MNLMDGSVELARDIRRQQGFAVYTLGNERIEVAVIPELGAKLISLKDLRTGREWMWHPGPAPLLFRNRPGDDFSKSPLAGADECLQRLFRQYEVLFRTLDHNE